MDIADIANDYEDQRRESLIQAMTQQNPVGPSLSECDTCGNDIPEARQKAVQGCTLCIACAEVRELMGRARRG